jgi:hypothetical protein
MSMGLGARVRKKHCPPFWIGKYQSGRQIFQHFIFERQREIETDIYTAPKLPKFSETKN